MEKITGKAFLLLCIVALIFTFELNAAWYSTTELTEIIGKDFNDLEVMGSNGYWVGRVLAGEFDSNNQPKNLKVKITWVTDRTDYRCNDIYIVSFFKVKEFTHRSLMLRKCN